MAGAMAPAMAGPTCLPSEAACSPSPSPSPSPETKETPVVPFLARPSRDPRETLAPDHSASRDAPECVASQTEKAVRRAPRTRMAEDWQPSERAIAGLAEEGVRREVSLACVREFVDFWTGDGRLKAAWDSVFRNRVRELRQQGRLPPPLPPTRKQLPLEAPLAPPPSPSAEFEGLTPLEVVSRVGMFRA